MPFFSELPEEPWEPEQPMVHYDFPNDRPQHWTPGTAALGVVVGRSDTTVVHVAVHDVYPRGLGLEVRALLHPDSAELDHMVMHRPGAFAGDLRLGLEWPDGRRVEAGNAWHPGLREPFATTPDVYLLQMRGGGGGGLGWSWDAWLYPLPMAGPVTVYCRWDERGIPETATTVDLTDVVAAASEARELWPLPPMPDRPDGEEFGWMAYSPVGAGFSPLTAVRPVEIVGGAEDEGTGIDEADDR
jgi:hypothetical protein